MNHQVIIQRQSSINKGFPSVEFKYSHLPSSSLLDMEEEEDVVVVNEEEEDCLFNSDGDGGKNKDPSWMMRLKANRTKFQGRRLRLLPLTILCVLGTALCILCYTSYLPPSSSPHLLPVRSSLLKVTTPKPKKPCNFPRLDPWDPKVKEFIRDPPSINCRSEEFPLRFWTNFKGQLMSEPATEGQRCCYRTLTRESGSDHNVRYSKKCWPIPLSLNDTSTQDISSDHEFISVKCSSNGNKTLFKDMFAFVPRKPSVEKRIAGIDERVKARGLTASGLSVVVLGLDAQSHMNFLRQMPSSASYLTRNLSAIGLQGYTKVGDNTFPNVIPLLTGLSVEELKKDCWPEAKKSTFDPCPFVWKAFKDSGYATSFAEDEAWMGTFNYDKNGFQSPPTDYYLNPLTLQMGKVLGHEVWGNVKLCYGPRLGFEVLLDYILKTAVALRDRRYFQFVWSNSLFHDYLNFPKIGDTLLLDTLKYLFEGPLGRNTVLLLVSDHGIRWGSIRSTYQGKVEERMPLAYFVFPKDFSRSFPREMEDFTRNAQERLTTPYDVHETLLHLLEMGTGRYQLDLHRSTYGQSLFTQVDPGRTCAKAGVDEHWCVCHRMEPLEKNDTLVVSAASFILKEINAQVSLEDSCAKLDLEKVTEAVMRRDEDEDKTQVQVTLVTKPGYAIFEATTTTVANASWTLSGEISRLNLYSDQSHCVVGPAQKYCYCKTSKTSTTPST